MSIAPRILRPTAEPAPRAILVGDPGRALFLAQRVIQPPAPMFNHFRGLWGYSGEAVDGSGPLVIQGTGIGGPSLRAVVSDLHVLGTSRMVRIGTAASASLPLGSVVIAASAQQAASGTAPTDPDADLFAGAVAQIRDAVTGPVLSADSQLDAAASEIPLPAVAADLSTATLYAVAEARGIAAVSLLCVTETGDGLLGDEDLEARVGGLAAAALPLLG